MKRYRIVSPIRFFIFIFIIIMSLILSVYAFVGAADTEASATESFRIVSVHEGDTLWTLAEDYSVASGIDQDVRQIVATICDTNDIEPDSVQPGDTIFVPVME